MTTNPYEASRVPEPIMGFLPPNGTSSEIEFELTVEDYVAFNHDYMDRRLGMRGIRVVLALLGGLSVPVGVAIYLNSVAVGSELGALLMLWAVANFLVFIGVAVWWYHRPRSWITDWIIRRYVAGDTSGIFGKYRMVLSPREIYERSPKAETRYEMSAVQRLIVAREHAFVFVSPVLAFIIPRRAFVPAETFEAFVHTLEEYSQVKATRS